MCRRPLLSRAVALLLLVLALAGCGSPPSPVTRTMPAPGPAAASPGPGATPAAPASPATPEVAPSAPAAPALPVAPAKPATVVGSEESSALLDNFTAFVMAVDGQAVVAGRDGWNTPIPLPAGLRRLKVAFNRGVFAAVAELTFTARPSGAYALKFASDAEIFGRNSYCEFWLVDTVTGEPATGRVRTALARREGLESK